MRVVDSMGEGKAMNQPVRTGSALRRGVRFAVLSVALAMAVACAKPSVVPPDEPVPETYVIGATDQLLIHVWKIPELNVGVPVRPDGKISMPLIDDVQAEGLTPEELKEVITASLAEFVTAPDVTVIVQGTNSYSASVMGDGIARKGRVPLSRDTTIVEVIASMNGFTQFASTKDIKVLRKTETGVEEYRFNYDWFVSGKEKNSNFLIKPGDTIVVSD